MIVAALSNIAKSLLAADTVVVDHNDRTMGIIAWLVVGLVAGFLGSKIVNKRGEGVLMDIILGLIGAFVGGFLFSLVGIHTGGSMILSIVIATIGAILVSAPKSRAKRRPTRTSTACSAPACRLCSLSCWDSRSCYCS